MNEMWEEALKHLREKMGNQNFETFIRPIRVREMNGAEITLEVPNKFFRDWLCEHFFTSIQETLNAVSRQSLRITIVVNQALQSTPLPEKPDNQARPKQIRVHNLISKYSFDNFVVGASNQFAHAASLAVANQPGEHHNPLFIYGGVGLGKTHLINAIGHQVNERAAGAKVGYFSAEAFMIELITAIREKRMDDFKNRFRKLDVLILDDVQFLAGREQTQVEFLNTLN